VALLEVRDLKVAYKVGGTDVHAVDGVSFDLERSHTLGIVGESGCGKSTLAFALTRLLPPNGRLVGGQVRFEGRDLATLSDADMRALRWKRIAMIFQAAMNSLNPVFRVGTLLREAVQTHESVSNAEADKRAVELFEMVGLQAQHLRNYPHELSGGMKQRVVIALSLVCRPSLIIADEPTTALDVVVQGQILRSLRALAAEMGIALIVISHDLGVIAELCDAVAVMYAGQIVDHGDAVNIFERPGHPYTLALMESIPSLSGPLRPLNALPGAPPNLMALPPGCRFAPRCAYVQSICREQLPPVLPVDAGHEARCHFAGRLEQPAAPLAFVGPQPWEAG
jgi:oligopeptide/dipeptide ABC transporter ATP-binding protein